MFRSSLSHAQDLPEAGVGGFNLEETQRIRAFKIPGGYDAASNPGMRFPRAPVVDVRQWRADHLAKLIGLEKAAGLR